VYPVAVVLVQRCQLGNMFSPAINRFTASPLYGGRLSMDGNSGMGNAPMRALRHE
jgi:hypothetical protein